MFTQKGFTPLHVTAKYNSVNVARLLLSKGSDANGIGRNDLTSLHVATQYGCTDVVRALLEGGADPNRIASVSELFSLRKLFTHQR